ncbi:MAG: M15 family metallopeptidase [Patescibacteria group bacterium]
MKTILNKVERKIIIACIFVIVICISFIAYGIYRFRQKSLSLQNTKLELASTTSALEKSNGALAQFQNENTALHTELTDQIAQNDMFGAQIKSISTTVGLLDKLSKTDRELLQKYSKVYFLSENFIPSSLSDIDTEFLFRKTKPEKIHTSVKPFLENLLRAANADSVQFFVLSAYRSFGTQANLKASYKVTYGTTAANKFSADQGYSEHQLGSAVDFTATSTGEILTGFEKTKSYEWLLQNAYRFGFIPSYPKENTYYIYEPWHWRFVGVELATKLHNEKKNFYDLDQREINTFLVKIFD